MAKIKSGAIQKQGASGTKGGSPAPGFYNNSRKPVDPKLDRHPHVGAKKEAQD